MRQRKSFFSHAFICTMCHYYTILRGQSYLFFVTEVAHGLLSFWRTLTVFPKLQGVSWQSEQSNLALLRIWILIVDPTCSFTKEQEMFANWTTDGAKHHLNKY